MYTYRYDTFKRRYIIERRGLFVAAVLIEDEASFITDRLNNKERIDVC